MITAERRRRGGRHINSGTILVQIQESSIHCDRWPDIIICFCTSLCSSPAPVAGTVDPSPSAGGGSGQVAARSSSSRACSGRCGHQLRFPFTCACDELCAQFSDCCEDYARACAPQQISALHAAHTSTLFTCLGSDTLLIGPLCIAYYPTFYHLCYRYRYTECLHEPVLDPTKYLMGAGPSTPRYFVSSCPPGYSATAPEALLCELHVLRPAINTSNHILFKVELS